LNYRGRALLRDKYSYKSIICPMNRAAKYGKTYIVNF
jgi:hypothetical protein